MAARRGGDVAADRLELQRGVVGERVLHVGDDRQVVVVDVDQLGGVHRLGAGLGDHEGDRVADVADRVTVSAGRAQALLTSAKGGTGSRPRSSAVKTATTPGDASASPVSTRVIRAWAKGLRTKIAWRVPSTRRLST